MFNLKKRSAVFAFTVLLSSILFAGCGANDASTEAQGTDAATGNSPQVDEKGYAVEDESPYAAMSEDGKSKFVREKSLAILKELGSAGEVQLSDDAVADIRKYVDSYAARAAMPRKNDCSAQGWIRSDLTSVIERGAEAAPQINKAFSDSELAPQIGLYIAMIESEYCPCLQSPTGPLGIFQLTTAEGRKFELATKGGASPADPDDRCVPAKAAAAEAKRIRSFVDRLVEESSSGTIGKKPGGLKEDSVDTVLLAVAAGNMGIENFVKAVGGLGLEGSPDFWTLKQNSDKLPEQFRSETARYVPKFIAAAIVGENPASFGVKDAKPLSSVK